MSTFYMLMEPSIFHFIMDHLNKNISNIINKNQRGGLDLFVRDSINYLLK